MARDPAYERSFAQKVLFRVRAHLPLVVGVKCSGASSVLKGARSLAIGAESELVLARTKKGYYVCLKINY